MRASSIILGLVLTCHVSAQQNYGDSSHPVLDKRYHWKRYTLPKLALPQALSSFLFPDDEITPAELQTDQTDVAAQSIVQPII